MKYDIAVIGGGPGGYVAAIKAAQHGKKVCLIEKDSLGGVCLNVGCMPTKTLLHTVEVLKTAKKAESFAVLGIEKAALRVDMKQLQARKNAVVTQLTGGIKNLLKKNGVTVEKGMAVFVSPDTVAVGEKEIKAEQFIVATGSHSFVPKAIAVSEGVMSSTEALGVEVLPKSVGIVGGGVIGIEFAYIFSALGAKVYLFEAMQEILPMVDEELAKLAREELEKNGVILNTGVSVKSADREKITYEKEGTLQVQEIEACLMAVGRKPNIEGMGLETIGIEIKNGCIVVDENLCTNVKNIYAIGDVTGHLMLAHTASKEAEVAVAHICTGKTEGIDYKKIPSCIYINPQLASIGLTEQQAKAAGLSYGIGRFPLSANGKSLVDGETKGLVKVLTDVDTGEIYGAHIYGAQATELIGEISIAMYAEATLESVTGAVHPHPTVSESIGEAFLDVLKKAVHI